MKNTKRNADGGSVSTSFSAAGDSRTLPGTHDFFGGGQNKKCRTHIFVGALLPLHHPLFVVFCKEDATVIRKKDHMKKAGVFLLGVNCRVARAWIFNCENAICWAMGMKKDVRMKKM